MYFNNNFCIICGSKSYGKPQCHNCYNNAVLCEEELANNKDIKKNNINLQELFIKTINELHFQNNVFEAETLCNKLIGIGFLEKENFVNSNFNLLNLAYTTIIDIRNQLNLATNEHLFNYNEQEQINNEHQDFRKQFPANIHCQDGHYVRSKDERTIDDYLYNEAKLLHAYEPKFRLTKEEKALCKNLGYEYEFFYPDFYIPKYNLYIEFFGKDDEKYNQKMDLKIDILNKRKNINFRYLTYKDGNLLIEKLEDILNEFK